MAVVYVGGISGIIPVDNGRQSTAIWFLYIIYTNKAHENEWLSGKCVLYIFALGNYKL